MDPYVNTLHLFFVTCTKLKKINVKKRIKKIGWDYIETAFHNRIKTIFIVVKKIENILKQYKSLKVNVILYNKFRAMGDGEIIEDAKHFQTANEIIS